MAGSITSVNSVISMSVTNLFAAPQVLQGYSADDIFTNEAIDAAETMMGLDGKLAAGFVPSAVTQNYVLMANSPSLPFFDEWYRAMKETKDVFFAQAVIVLPSVFMKYTMINGVLRNYPPLPNASRTLRPRTFTIQWESADPQVIAAGAA